ncbi:GYDIA family GHMP kinase [Cellulophaga sp. F20128]|uniref:GYDIA family GHMP kinase n=1 Tax=Cellulophaga sp. F20128 TaxID=2926413 RepID=UPI001FF17098|nr:GYDIA family GHMP kinase [Cellulophaga sp. F20128]MCK0157356.1 GYDIA family GHMP kinase [Cellulophaga sp. F20128]
MTKEFYSNGKLLLTGEYAVLDGALSLAVPTKYGQYMTVTRRADKLLLWKSYDHKNSIWFDVGFDRDTIALVHQENRSSVWHEIAKTLQSILKEAKKLNPNFLQDKQGYTIETKLTFPRNWGLGSSSTLINNIAQWAKVDAFLLVKNTMGGSGYDIACAQNNEPIFYQKQGDIPSVTIAAFKPEFVSNLFFVHLNRKQNSREAIAAYRQCLFDKKELLTAISALTKKIASAENLKQFETLITAHEEILSEVLQIPTVKKQLFPDYKGSIKSLGAWGGDFILATGATEATAYFKGKGYPTILSYAHMIK